MNSDAGPNILLVVVDSLRARNVGAYGYHHDTTPFLDSLADRSLIYESAWSPAVWTLPSHVSMLTGYEVREHDIRSAADAIDPEAVVFRELAESAGYSTGVFSENTWITEADMGISRSFDTVVGKPSILYPDALSPGEFAHENEYGDYVGYLRASLASSQPIRSMLNGVVSKLQYDVPSIGRRLMPEASGKYFVDEFINWQRNQTGPWAACINLMDAHRPYVPDQRYDEWDDGTAREIQESLDDPVRDFLDGQEPLWKLRALEALYDGGIQQADAHLGRVVENLENQGVFEDTLLIVTGDHGEGFGERSVLRGGPAVEHKEGLHQVQTHVPLLVNPPDDRQERIETPVSLTETARVIRDVVEHKRVEYCRDEPVISVCDDVSAQFVSTNEMISEEARMEAVVERRNAETIRYLRYRNCNQTTVTEVIHDAQTSFERSGPGPDPDIDDAFEGLENRSHLQDDATITHEAVDRLEDLGYV